MTSLRGRHLAAPVLAVALLTGCTSAPEAAPEPVETTASAGGGDTGTVQTLASGLESPWSIAFIDNSALVSERNTGRIVELTDDGTTREVGVVEGSAHRGEGGLLGLAVRDTDLYVFTTTDTDNRIIRYPLNGDAGSYTLGNADIILDGLPASSYHDGGRIAFGPDGMLYATVGDTGSRTAAQDIDDLGGKILRLTPDGEVPADNPFPDSFVYSYGHRNPQGLDWAEDGTLYASEFGQDTWDELNVIQPGGNYGWPEVEGIVGQAEYVDPVQQWDPANASPSGMSIVDGTIYIANLRGARLWTVPLSDVTTSTDQLVGEYGRLRDVVEAPDGSLWVLTSNTDGRGEPSSDDDRVLRVVR
ncbi:PQQ-dependent sugar dehydrogenase [Microbacterium sp. ISL-103]|uniref:PQQ-dependent sugar dehydrogenase n=1 Tax=Microbacterium sp. ISL-103 TaxID=2819156 RepID=UPI001BEB0589|nr:PQQ-dependent sugar dehydrogenase [Microbacterium sp. ISL-103]MBT2475806.1 PQQ-dependent sugar dehydrogenase [Microbacterium sp. ISL-103]